jgi:hypothetical protein
MEKTKSSELSDEEKEILRKYHEDKRKAVLAQLSEINSKIEKYGGAVKSKAQTSIAFANGFPSKASKPARLMFIITQFNRFVTIQEWLNRYGEYVPSVTKDGKIIREEYRTGYGAVLNKLKAKELVRYMAEDGRYRYGLPDWANPDGTPKEEYK